MKSRLKKKNRVALYIAMFVAVLSCGITAYLSLVPFFKQETELYISDKDSADSVIKMIARYASACHVGIYSCLSSIDGNGTIQSGYYRFTNEPLIKVYRRISKGRQNPVSFTFNNVRTLEQFAAKIDKALMIDSAQFMEIVADTLFLKRYGYNRQTLPSLFIPNKYELYWNISVEDFFKRMKVEHDHFWNKERLLLLQKIKLTEFEVSTLASIVEEESNDSEDRRIIAGLYLNRLKQGMPMQACPTIRYAHNDFSITRVFNHHTLIESPYNTYRIKGLPPGPIRIPSISAIDAVLHYQPNDYLYMCAKEDFSGKHRFASSYNEHLRNAQLYQKAFDKRYNKDRE